MSMSEPSLLTSFVLDDLTLVWWPTASVPEDSAPWISMGAELLGVPEGQSVRGVDELHLPHETVVDPVGVEGSVV